MALQVNGIQKEVGDVTSGEPIMVTITLEEYRSLIEENTRLLCDLERLTKDLDGLVTDNTRLRRLVGDDK